jgi:RNA polymerase sigma-70 factor (ECF subfamily)
MSVELAIDRVPDAGLLPRIAAGDGEAFAALYRRRHADVYRFALHMTASTPVAEDVMQDVFLAVMRDAGRYESGRATVAAWLCGIARNHVRRRLERDRRLEPLDEERHEGLQDEAPDRFDPLEDLIRAERIESLRLAVLALPLRYREVVVLCDLQELSYADAAEAIGCAVGTVRSRLHRGRALLAAKMAAVVVSKIEPDKRPARLDASAGATPSEPPEERRSGDSALKPGGCVA